MIPQSSESVFDFGTEYELQTSKTYMLHPEIGIISGIINQKRAMEQAVYKILNTERYKYLIYSWNYGIELEDLVGEQIQYVMPELERRISEALIQDERVTLVDNFEFEVSGGVVSVAFTVHTIFGDMTAGKEVEY